MSAGLIVILGYAVLVTILGIVGLRQTKSFSDYFLGGRTVGPWLTAFTYGTAYFSAVLFIGFAGKIGWSFGMSGLWIAIGNSLIGVLLVWWLLGEKIRTASIQTNAHTMPEYLEARYKSPFIKVYTSIAIFIFFIPYTAAVYMGLSYLFETYFGFPYWTVLVFMALFTGVYMVLGGYKSMIMVDFIFGITMIFGVVILIVSCVSKAGGLSSISAQLSAIDPKLMSPIGPPGWWQLFSLAFLTSVAPLAMPQLVQKFYAIKDKKSIRIGMIASTLFAIIISGAAYFTGALTRIFINPTNNPAAFIQTANGSAPNFDALMPELLAKAVSPSLSIFILLLVLAASMSTLAALVIISSSTIAKDLYVGFIDKKASDKKLMLLMRLLSIFFLALSVILALLKPGIIVTILSISWGAIASVFLGPFIWGLFSKRATKTGALVSSFAGLTTCLALYFILGAKGAPQAGTIGMLVSLITAPIFMCWKNQNQNKQ